MFKVVICVLTACMSSYRGFTWKCFDQFIDCVYMLIVWIDIAVVGLACADLLMFLEVRVRVSYNMMY